MTPQGAANAWDTAFFHAFNQNLGPGVDALVRFFHGPASALLFTALLLGYCVWRWRAKAAPVVVAAVLATVATDVVGARVLKPAISRTRPCYALPEGSFRQLVPAADSGSLPSLHAANWFAAVTPIAVAAPAAGPVLFGLAAVAGLTRVVGGVHWPSDVLVGALVGVAMGLLASWLVRTFVRWRARPRALVPGPG